MHVSRIQQCWLEQDSHSPLSGDSMQYISFNIYTRPIESHLIVRVSERQSWTKLLTTRNAISLHIFGRLCITAHNNFLLNATLLVYLTYEKNGSLSYRYGQKIQSESRLEPLLGNVSSLDWNRWQAVFQNETPQYVYFLS